MLHPFSNNIAIDRSKCTFCGICVDRCILDHMRLQMSPCRVACPIGQNCHSYVQQLFRRQNERGLATILESNPLPAVLGRICHHPCQDACARRQVDGKPINIRALKRFLSETVARPPWEGKKNIRPENVGIIGSGPAALMAAWHLRRNGYRVVVYEKENTPGGHLTRTIPEFRLPRKVALGDIQRLESAGVEFRLNAQIGADREFNDWRKRQAAILVAAGTTIPVGLNIAGEDAPNVYSAVPFLEGVKSGHRPHLGRSVVVIGGGNVAIDAAQTARRLGAEFVRMVCLERREEMPAHADSITEAVEENVEIECGWGPRSFQMNGSKAAAVNCELCVCVWKDQCFAPEFNCQVGKTFHADSFIVAVGIRPDQKMWDSLGLSPGDENGKIVDPLTGETGIGGVFAAGDIIGGAGSVVEAMASGRRAAISIDRYLRGMDLRYGRSYPGPLITDFPIPKEGASGTPPQETDRIPPSERKGMEESDGGFGETEAFQESTRCLSCGVPVGCNDSCWYCLPCEVSCPEDALRVEIPSLIR